ncbi:hypothetical protein B0H13DRAFT_355928 [Mycena leptocephala]|nr:hypothetical protein B0H13DRAFT_355928 [Mycena leptocephala]
MKCMSFLRARLAGNSIPRRRFVIGGVLNIPETFAALGAKVVLIFDVNIQPGTACMMTLMALTGSLRCLEIPSNKFARIKTIRRIPLCLELKLDYTFSVSWRPCSQADLWHSCPEELRCLARTVHGCVDMSEFGSKPPVPQIPLECPQ